MFSAASLALSTCFNLAQRHQIKKYNTSLRKKVAKRKKTLAQQATQQIPAAATTKTWLNEFDINNAAVAGDAQKSGRLSSSEGSSSS